MFRQPALCKSNITAEGSINTYSYTELSTYIGPLDKIILSMVIQRNGRKSGGTEYCIFTARDIESKCRTISGTNGVSPINLGGLKKMVDADIRL